MIKGIKGFLDRFAKAKESEGKSLAEVFNQFTGKKIQVFEFENELPDEGDVFKAILIEPEDRMFQQIEKLAKDNRLALRVNFPGWSADKSPVTNSVTIDIEKLPKNKFRISKIELA